MKTLLPIVLLAAPAMFAGEYGLAVGPSYPHPCEFGVSRSLNSCTTVAVAEDLRRHFISGEPFRLEAVKMAVLARELENEERPPVRARLLKAFSALPPSRPAIHAPPAPSPPRAALLAYKRDLHQAGDRNECEAAVQRVSHAMATDARLSDAAIQAEIDHFEKVKGPMPYPTPGTACALFGFQEAAHAALNQRRRPNAH